MREKEDAKCKEEEEKDHKQMRQAKAEEKKRQQQAKREKQELTEVKKAKVAVIKALAAPRLKRNIKLPRRLQLESESESSDKDTSVYSSSEESSEAGDEYEGSSANCMNAGRCSKVKKKEEQWGAIKSTADGGSTQNGQMWIFWGKCLRK